jgi:hypothetical protein
MAHGVSDMDSGSAPPSVGLAPALCPAEDIATDLPLLMTTAVANKEDLCQLENHILQRLGLVFGAHLFFFLPFLDGRRRDLED